MLTVNLMQTALSQSTGLKDREQKLITYWTLATHALETIRAARERFNLLRVKKVVLLRTKSYGGKNRRGGDLQIRSLRRRDRHRL